MICGPVQRLKVWNFFMTFPNYVCTSFWRKKQKFFSGGGDPPKPLRQNLVSQKKKSNFFFALDSQFLFYNIKVLYKIGCLQKTRVQKIENWPSYGHLKIISVIFWFFRKIGRRDKNWNKSANFGGIEPILVLNGQKWLSTSIPCLKSIFQMFRWKI